AIQRFGNGLFSSDSLREMSFGAMSNAQCFEQTGQVFAFRLTAPCLRFWRCPRRSEARILFRRRFSMEREKDVRPCRRVQRRSVPDQRIVSEYHEPPESPTSMTAASAGPVSPAKAQKRSQRIP